MKVKSGLSERNNFKSDNRYATLLVYIFLFASVSITLSSQSHEQITSRDIKVNQPCIKHQNIYHPLAIADKNFEARYLYGNRRANGIKIAHMNLGSGYLVNRMNDIEILVRGYTPHVLGISEPCFKDYHNKSDLYLENYRVFLAKTLENEELKYSRISVFVHKDVIVKERNDLMSDSFSSIWLELGLPKQKKILVCNLYREWQYLNQADTNSRTVSAQLARWINFLDQWEKAIAEGKECHVIGDCNLDFLTWKDPSLPDLSKPDELKPLVNQLFDRIFPFGFVQHVSTATRFWPNTNPSGLDHWYSNQPRKLSEIQVHFHGGSDHKLLFGVRYSKSVIDKPRIVRKRSYKNFNPQEFLLALQCTSWWDVYSSEDPDLAVTIFTRKVNSILDVLAPIKTTQIRNNYAPWLSPDICTKMKARDVAHEKAALSGNSDDWKNYKQLRNQINNKLRAQKSVWQTEKLIEYSSDSSTTWKHIRTWLGWTTGGPPTKLMTNGRLETKPKALAEIMNQYFVEKVQQLRQNLPPSNINPLSLPEKMMQNRRCSFSLQAVHPDQISKIISGLKSSKSCGIDNVDAYILKLGKEELIPVITHIVNLSIKYRVFPKYWKMAKVVPLHKKDDVTNPKNYRPVSLLSVTSKILERAVFAQLIIYLEENNLLHPSHHGFRSKHNTSTAILQM